MLNRAPTLSVFHPILAKNTRPSNVDKGFYSNEKLSQRLHVNLEFLLKKIGMSSVFLRHIKQAIWGFPLFDFSSLQVNVRVCLCSNSLTKITARHAT